MVRIYPVIEVKDFVYGHRYGFTQSGGWTIRTTNYIEYELHPNAVSRECAAERLKAVLPKEAAYEKDVLLSVLTHTTPQALLTDPQFTKLITLGLMEYREAAIAPTQLPVSLLGMLF